MKLVIGLGNPGGKYKNTRHNVGHVVVDKLKIHSKGLVLLKSDKFMNDSGSFVKKVLASYQPLTADHLYVVHDDLDIKLGDYKILFGKGPKDHNGLNDIYEKLGTKDFWHVRVGIDARNTEDRISGEEYVLCDFTGEEKPIIDSLIKKICKKLVTL